MTCIVGIEVDGNVFLGGDSAAVGGDASTYHRVIVAEPKVFRNGDFIMGYTSSFRMGQLLQHSLKPRKQKPSQSDAQYLVTDFMDAVIELFQSKGFLSTRNEETTGEYVGGSFLLGYRGKLYEVNNDFQVTHSVHGFAAVGSGTPLALGSLHATQLINDSLLSDNVQRDPSLFHVPIDHMTRLKMALDAAVQFNAGVAGPFTFISLKP